MNPLANVRPAPGKERPTGITLLAIFGLIAGPLAIIVGVALALVFFVTASVPVELLIFPLSLLTWGTLGITAATGLAYLRPVGVGSERRGGRPEHPVGPLRHHCRDPCPVVYHEARGQGNLRPQCVPPAALRNSSGHPLTCKPRLLVAIPCYVRFAALRPGRLAPANLNIVPSCSAPSWRSGGWRRNQRRPSCLD